MKFFVFLGLMVLFARRCFEYVDGQIPLPMPFPGVLPVLPLPPIAKGLRLRLPMLFKKKQVNATEDPLAMTTIDSLLIKEYDGSEPEWLRTAVVVTSTIPEAERTTGLKEFKALPKGAPYSFQFSDPSSTWLWPDPPMSKSAF